MSDEMHPNGRCPADCGCGMPMHAKCKGRQRQAAREKRRAAPPTRSRLEKMKAVRAMLTGCEQ